MRANRRDFLKAVTAAAVLPMVRGTNPSFTVNRGNMWPHDATSTETLARCDRLLAANPDDVLALVHRGQVSPFVRAEALAETDLSKAIRLEPDNPALFYIRGVTFNHGQDLLHAIRLLSVGGDQGGEAHCTSQPDIYKWVGTDQGELLYMTLRELGGVLEEEGHTTEALESFERVANFQVIRQPNLERWAEAYTQVGRWCEAVVGYRRLIEMQARPEYFRRLEACKS